MFKVFSLIFLLLAFFLTPPVFAKTNSFVSVVNPVRGGDFWEQKEKPEYSLEGQIEILKKSNLQSTWLLRFDVLDNKKIIDKLNGRLNDEKGLFLEITPSLTKASGVNYNTSENWHEAGSAFLTGYERTDREKLIDASFKQFKEVFGSFPKSVGAWWIDAYSLDYMHKIYSITSAMIVSDQYTTDNYQIWGQYFSTPYYPSKNNALHPAGSLEHKLPVVVIQWAPRDPVNSYGNGVFESTFSLQANDYKDFHTLDINYFEKLLNIYTEQRFNKFSHLVVGLENSYDWGKYAKEYENQIRVLSERQRNGQTSIVTMSEFATWYKENFPALSPEQIIIADDPLGSQKKAVWFMSPFYRAGWFVNEDGSLFRDIRQYVAGEEELCFKERCDEINFATSATRVLDEVSFGHKWVLDEGGIRDFKVSKLSEKYVITYENEGGTKRTIEFLPRDIGVDGKVYSIDTAILEATKNQIQQDKVQYPLKEGMFKWSLASVLIKTFKFLIFLLIGCLVPGLFLLGKVLPPETPFLQKSALALTLGFTIFTILFFLLSQFGLKQTIFVYLFLNLLLLVKLRKEIFNNFSFNFKDKFNLLLIGLIIAGCIFQQLPTFKNGLKFPYGMGFWGPNSHDGVWHIALINQLKTVPPQNPIFSGEILKNYHFFYDLLVAATNYLSGIPVVDLLFRFYPVIFSLILGISSYYLIRSFFKAKIAAIFSLYLIYFSGSFGWIVEYIKFKHLGGESAFWANQSISFNLNPPFAISLLIIIAIFQLLPVLSKSNKFSIIILTILSGSLIAFKAYAGVLILLTILAVGILRKNFSYIIAFVTSATISAALFFPSFSVGQKLMVFSPFWFIHSMIDSPDRVGWSRLSLAREAGFATGNWFKFLSAEIVSFILFLFGNLGMRFFALIFIFKMKTIFKRNEYLFLFLFSALSFLIPILFIQSGNPWNTIQFTYYGLYVAALVSGVVIAKLYLKLNRFLFLAVAFFIIFLTPINSWATANGYLGYKPHARISSDEVAALEFLKARDEGVVLTYPYDENLKKSLSEPWPLYAYDSTAYVSALSQKRSFLEDEPQNQILLTDYRESGALKKRIVGTKDFFSNPAGMLKFLEDNRIKYIYLPKIFNVRVDEVRNIKKIFENDQVIIYKFGD